MALVVAALLGALFLLASLVSVISAGDPDLGKQLLPLAGLAAAPVALMIAAFALLIGRPWAAYVIAALALLSVIPLTFLALLSVMTFPSSYNTGAFAFTSIGRLVFLSLPVLAIVAGVTGLRLGRRLKQQRQSDPSGGSGT